MGLLSNFKRQADGRSASPAADAGDEVQRARTRARRRLIGAAVLLGIGIVGFPLVFETQPRPIPVNIPIETPPKEGAAPLVMPAARSSTATAASSTGTASKPAAPIITETREDAGREVANAASRPGSSASTASRSAAEAKPAEPKPADARPTEPKIAEPKIAEPKVAEPKVAERKTAEAKTAEPKARTADARPVEPKAPAADAARARALLEGKEPTPNEAGRFVVQVGAFADVAAARETRAKVEKLGLKTYTQVASTASGQRIRVRAGPYNSRAEADQALAKARAAGLTAVVLSL